MENSLRIDDEVSELLGENLKPESAWLMKVGLSYLQIKEGIFNSILYEIEEKEKRLFHDFVIELYRILSESPHVMDIEPDENEALAIGKTAAIGRRYISLNKPIKIRVSIPERLKPAYSSYLGFFSPEHFTIYFNGLLFFTTASIPNIPSLSWLGQIARDFLENVLINSALWEIKPIGPSPIDPNIFFLVVPELDEIKIKSGNIPRLSSKEENIYILLPKEIDLDSVVHSVSVETQIELERFYEYRILVSEIKQLIWKLESQNRELTLKLSDYFRISPIMRTISGVAPSVRSILSEMHQNIY